MGTNDRYSQDDDDRQRRSSDDRTRPSRPRGNDAGDGGNTPRPRPRSDRDDRYDDAGYTPRSGSPSRSRRDDQYDDTPRSSSSTRSRRDNADDTPRSGSPTRNRGDVERSRGPAQRIRDSLTGAYQAVSREVRALGRRASAGRDRAPDPYDRGQQAASDFDYDDRAWGGGAAAPPSRRALAATPVRPASHRSLAMRVINRRRAMRDPNKAIIRSIVTTFVSITAIIIIAGGGITAGYAYAKTQQYAAIISSMGLSHDLQSSRIYDRHGQLLFQTFGQDSSIREYLDYCEIPPLVQQATIDTEDNSFWSNPGINLGAIVRSALFDAGSSSTVAGASTITQQLVKLDVLDNSQQNIQNKINQAILALDVTQHYTKQDILTMYLNIVTYGYNYEGIETAADNFFHLRQQTVALNTTVPTQKAFLQYYKQCMSDEHLPLPKIITMSAAWQLQPWQATVLVGAPNNPNIYNPYVDPQAANNRQCTNVLTSMANDGDSKYLYITDPTTGAQKAASAADLCQYTLQELTAKDSKTGVLLNIFPNRYQGAAAQYQKLAPWFVDYVTTQLASYFPNGVQGFDTAGWNVYTTLDYGDPSITTAQLASVVIDPATGQLTSPQSGSSSWIPRIGLEQYAEFLVMRDVTEDFPDYWYCGPGGYSHPDPNIPYQPASTNAFYNASWCWETPLDSATPNVHDGGLTAIDPKTGDILAMVGSPNYNSIDPRVDGQFNVTTSPSRSLGSSFKPIVYATAFQEGWNPGIVINDQPTCFPGNGAINGTQSGVAGTSTGNGEQSATDEFLCPGNYLPHNYCLACWAGPEPITYLLGNSLNTPAEMALSYVGLGANSPLFQMAPRLGITTLSPAQLGPSTAIGTQGVPLLQETSAYATFADNGYHYVPRGVLQIVRADGSNITDQNGHVLFGYTPTSQGYQAISPQAAYMVTSVLTDNNAREADFGAENPLYFPGRDVAAKTGTSDSLKDIVTMGYTPWLAIGVWVGNADNEPAVNIIGIAGAGYIFQSLMAFAINQMHMPGQLPSINATPAAGGYFPVPSDMHLAILNCQDGLAPWKGMNLTDPNQYCDPHDKNRVPAAISTEFDWCSDDTKVSKPYPNEADNCKGDPGTNKYFDDWTCESWGCNSGNGINPGQDVAWVVDGQDPTVP